SVHAGIVHPGRRGDSGDPVCVSSSDDVAGAGDRAGRWSDLRMPTEALTEKSGFFHALKSAIVGDPHRDFTQGSIGRAIAMLAIPMVLEMMMESLFAVVDMFWVAHLGANAVATVGFTESLLILLFAVALGLSIATTATVARR